MLCCDYSGQSPVPQLVRPPPANDVSYDVVAGQFAESVEHPSVLVHAATTSRWSLLSSLRRCSMCNCVCVYVSLSVC